MKVLVTGASGFLGSALCHHFSRSGHEVVAILRASSSQRRLEGLSARVERCASTAEIAEAAGRCQPDAIVHTACSYGRQGEGLQELTDANVRLGVSLLQAVLSSPATAKRVVFLNTGTALPSHVSNYALSKHQFAEWGRRIAAASPGRLRFVNVELQHMYGPGDDSSKFTTHVIHACRNHVPALPLTAGEQRRDFIYIDDVVDGYDFLLQRAAGLRAAVDVPLGSGQAPTIREYVTLVHELCESRTNLQFGAIKYRTGEAMHCLADLSLMAELGWAPRWQLRDGISRTLELESFK